MPEETINKTVPGKHGGKCRISCKMKIREPQDGKKGADMDMTCDMEGDCKGIGNPMDALGK